MANDVGVSPAKLAETVNTLTEQKSVMQSKLSNISSSVDNMNTAWKSDASASLSLIASQMSERFMDLDKEVNQFIEFLNQIIANYEKTESRQQNLVDELLSRFK